MYLDISKHFFLFVFLIFAQCSSSHSAIAKTKQSPFALLAQKYFQSKNYQKAEEYFKKSLLENSEDIESTYKLAKLYFVQKDHLNAFKYFRETLSLNKKYEDTVNLFKESLRQLRNSKTLQFNSSPEAKTFLIYLALNAKQFSKAKSHIDALIKQHPDYAFGWDDLASYHYKQGEIQQAMVAIKKALSLNANSPTIFKHYEKVYFKLNHEAAPPRRQQETQVISNTNADFIKSLDQKIQTEEKPKDIVVANNVNVRDLEANILKNLIDKQKHLIIVKPKVSVKKAEKTTKAVYVPLPEVNNDAVNEKENMTASAANNFAEKNWELAYKIYQLLSENHPNEPDFKEKALQAKSYADFEYDFLRARSFFKKGAKNPQNYTKSKEIFNKLDPRIYFKLYQRHSFDDYLGRIAFTTKNYAQAEKHYQSWLRKEPKDIEVLYLLLLSQDFQGKSAEAFETFKSGVSINRKMLLSKEGISKLQIKLYVIHYWWIGLIIIILWAVLTFTYISVKGYRRTKVSGRKNAIELVNNLYSESKWLEMIEKIDALLLTELTPEEIQKFQYMKATGLYKAQQYSFAERQAKALISRNKENKKAVLLLGKIYAKQENTNEECIESYTLLFKKTKKPEIEFLRVFIKTLKAAKQFGKLTESVAHAILKIDAYNQQALIDLVEIFLKRDNTDQSSIDIYKRYLEMHPNNILVNTQYLKSLLKAQEYIEIVKIAKKLINTNPDIPEVHTHLIQAFNELGMKDEMNDYYQLLSLDYNHSPVVQKMLLLVETNYKSTSKSPKNNAIKQTQNDQQLKSFFDLGKKYMEEAKYTEAKIEFQKVIKDDNLGFSASMHLIRMEIGEESWSEAEYLLNQVTLLGKLTHFDLENLYDMAEHYKSQGESQKALDLYQIIAKNDVSFKDTFQKIEEINLPN
ncbi:MAG: tetratricopeptide repeat protein [Candidatus Cloacimonetes bacterium]|nr:tetratricopeptide repeat protein [Candidatus Cloacimonadota bacterium]